jgi:hypothetical protein
MSATHETSDADRGVYFDMAREDACGCCGATIREGETAIYDADGLLCGYECGCGDPHYADAAAPQ